MIALGYSTRGLARQLFDRAVEAVAGRVVLRALCLIGAHDWRFASITPGFRHDMCKTCPARRMVPR